MLYLLYSAGSFHALSLLRTSESSLLSKAPHRQVTSRLARDFCFESYLRDLDLGVPGRDHGPNIPGTSDGGDKKTRRTSNRRRPPGAEEENGVANLPGWAAAAGVKPMSAVLKPSGRRVCSISGKMRARAWLGGHQRRSRVQPPPGVDAIALPVGFGHQFDCFAAAGLVLGVWRVASSGELMPQVNPQQTWQYRKTAVPPRRRIDTGRTDLGRAGALWKRLPRCNEYEEHGGGLRETGVLSGEGPDL